MVTLKKMSLHKRVKKRRAIQRWEQESGRIGHASRKSLLSVGHPFKEYVKLGCQHKTLCNFP